MDIVDGWILKTRQIAAFEDAAIAASDEEACEALLADNGGEPGGNAWIVTDGWVSSSQLESWLDANAARCRVLVLERGDLEGVDEDALQGVLINEAYASYYWGTLVVLAMAAA